MSFLHISSPDSNLEIVSNFFDKITSLTMEIHQLTDELDILNITVEKTRNILNCDRTIIYQLLPQKDGVIIAESVEKKWVSILGKLVYDPCFSENLIESYCRGRFSIIENIYSSGLESCH